MKSQWSWMLAGIGLAIGWGLLAVSFPAGIKKLGLFSLASGLVLGLACYQLKEFWNIAARRFDLYWIIFSGGVTETVRLVASYFLFVHYEQKALEEHLKQMPGFAQEMSKQFTDQRVISWADYLATRYIAFSGQPKHFFGETGLQFLLLLEVLLAMIGAGLAIFVWRRMHENREENGLLETQNGEKEKPSEQPKGNSDG